MTLKFFENTKKISFLIFFIFLISRVFVYYFLDIRLSDVNYGYHLLDKDLLNYQFFSSLFYLHSQPYLWNLFNGVVVNIFDGNYNSIVIFFSFYLHIFYRHLNKILSNHWVQERYNQKQTFHDLQEMLKIYV